MLLPLGILASAGGVSAAYELISTTVLGSSQASVTFSGLDTSAAAYKHLQIRMATSASAVNNATLRFNSDTGANYSWHYMDGNGSSVTSGAGTSASYALLGGMGNTANVFLGQVIDILDFASTTKYKTTRALAGLSSSNVTLLSGSWRNTSAVTSITLGQVSYNYVAGSRFSLYGIRGS